MSTQPNSAAVDTDVLIVGAGPTGLMLANQLARRGVRVLIVEKNSGPSLQTRALGVQARTLEIYSHLGIAENAVALGKPAHGAQMWSQGRRTAHVPLIDAGSDLSPYPYLLVLGQDDNERLLGDRLRAQGVSVEWNTRLESLDAHPDHVVATLALADGGMRTVKARWVAGCDGSRSRVRELNGIDFVGAAYEHVFYVADVQATGEMVADEVNVFLWRDGFHLFFPLRGENHWRVVGILPPELRHRDDIGFDDVLASLYRETELNVAFDECRWFSTYRIHHRRAERFRAGRCFLLGDAAHVHSPVGAQGMNTGLQDAYNLGWKLALVARGQADESLLQSYEEERIPVAKRLLDTTDRGFRLVVSDNPLAGILRTQVIARIAARAMRHKGLQAAAFRTISQIGVNYRGCGATAAPSAMPKGSPRAGDRFPWLRLLMRRDGVVEDLFQHLPDTQFHLLVFGQPAPHSPVPGLEGVVHIHAIPDCPENHVVLERAGVPRRSYFLLRPDGYVGVCGERLDARVLEAYVAEQLRMGRRSL